MGEAVFPAVTAIAGKEKTAARDQGVAALGAAQKAIPAPFAALTGRKVLPQLSLPQQLAILLAKKRGK